ncbi:LysR family transcriptional regulator [Labrenzia sp. PHM005]|uniref:LysR family transcriptional regulator n=1 Tax=Labrenzia sp. PHM005 TaxID=2590016 RepID=UPI00114089B1|nr:LysR family transcriptional regulator [Labrenzia sp. PHM005]QDG77180.1 LysR family transcriptional regulator [Labrenzia sp. PHM005]
MALDLIQKGLKFPHMRLLVELGRQKKVTSAASSLGIAQPAASRLIAEIEDIVDAEVCVRTGRGVELTEIGTFLADRCIRILQEVSDTGLAIDQQKRGVSGHVRIGSVTGPAVEHVIPALNSIRDRYPDISIFVEVGPSTNLAGMLAAGSLDFALSRLPATLASATFDEQPIGREPACIIARSGHPDFENARDAALQALLKQDWLLPPEGAPLRASLEDAFREHGLTPPTGSVTVSSFLFTLIMVQSSNALAPIAKSVADSFAGEKEGADGPIKILETDLKVHLNTYSLLTRTGQKLTPAAQLVADEVVRRANYSSGLRRQDFF